MDPSTVFGRLGIRPPSARGRATVILTVRAGAREDPGYVSLSFWQIITAGKLVSAGKREPRVRSSKRSATTAARHHGTGKHGCIGFPVFCRTKCHSVLDGLAGRPTWKSMTNTHAFFGQSVSAWLPWSGDSVRLPPPRTYGLSWEYGNCRACQTWANGLVSPTEM